MKEIRVYQADDGTRFSEIEHCRNYENLCKRVELAMNILKTGFKADEHTAIRHNKENVREAFEEFMKICAETIPVYASTFLECADGKRHCSHVIENTDIYGNFRVFVRTADYFRCIDFETGIEYDQPYFVYNPDKFKGRIVNIALYCSTTDK